MFQDHTMLCSVIKAQEKEEKRDISSYGVCHLKEPLGISGSLKELIPYFGLLAHSFASFHLLNFYTDPQDLTFAPPIVFLQSHWWYMSEGLPCVLSCWLRSDHYTSSREIRDWKKTLFGMEQLALHHST